MAIRDIVTGGYGNGTFNGTIALVTLRGYVASQAAPAVGGPFCVIAFQVLTAGASPETQDVFKPGHNGNAQQLIPGATPTTQEVC